MIHERKVLSASLIGENVSVHISFHTCILYNREYSSDHDAFVRVTDQHRRYTAALTCVLLEIIICANTAALLIVFGADNLILRAATLTAAVT